MRFELKEVSICAEKEFELIRITDPVREKHFNDALSILKGMSVLKEVSGVIRVYGN